MLRPDDARRVEYLCDRISRMEEVKIGDMIWLEKWSGVNSGVREKVRRARRSALRGKDCNGLDEFCDAMGLGDPDPSKHIRGFDGADDIAEWFREDRPDDWRQRD